jgi:hypothetical protein
MSRSFHQLNTHVSNSISVERIRWTTDELGAVIPVETQMQHKDKCTLQIDPSEKAIKSIQHSRKVQRKLPMEVWLTLLGVYLTLSSIAYNRISNLRCTSEPHWLRKTQHPYRSLWMYWDAWGPSNAQIGKANSNLPKILMHKRNKDTKYIYVPAICKTDPMLTAVCSMRSIWHLEHWNKALKLLEHWTATVHANS